MDTAAFHSALEFMASALCFLIAYLAWLRVKKTPTGLNALWCVTFIIVGVLESVHAGMSLGIPGLVDYWVPFTWAVSRAVLAFLLLAAVKFAAVPARRVWLPATICGVAFASLLFPFGESFSFVYQDSIIKRPLDFGLMWAWLALLIVFVRSPITALQLPGGVTHLFLILGIASHAMMSFGSIQSLDFWFLAAHVTKNLELLAWLICAIVEHRFAHGEEFQSVYQHRAEVMLAKSGSDLDALRESVRSRLDPAADVIIKRRGTGRVADAE